MEVVCTKCGVIGEYRTEKRGPHLSAWCTACGSFIKHLPQQKAMFYFGKYKGTAISDCTDLKYLIWAETNALFRGPQAKEAALDRIKELGGNNG